MRHAIRATTAVAIIAAALALGSDGASAHRVPVTLADQKPVQAGPVVPGFPIDFVGVVWDTPTTGTSVEIDPAAPNGAIRFLADGDWGPWIPLVEEGAEAPGQWGSGLVSGGDADAYQIRGIPEGVGTPRAVAINTTDGPTDTVRERPAVSAFANCLSRADWGADETLRFETDGTESWPTTFTPVQALTVHHTVTDNNDPDPAATVRAIYRFHTVDRDWGDIAYQYLIDEAGRIYEGRWSGSESRSCIDDGGDGSDFGHDSADAIVTGGHTAYYNQGNVGLALLGDLTSAHPTVDAWSALEQALAELAARHGVDPLGTVMYENPVWTTSATVDAISGHRDWPSPAGDTACPGDSFYPHLPEVRLAVASILGQDVPTIGVSGISYSRSGGRSSTKDLTVTISVEPPLPDTVITAQIDGPSGIGTTVVTDASGTASIFVRNAADGCYQTVITAVSAAGHLWDGVTPENRYGCDTTTTSSTTTTTTTTVGTVTISSIEPISATVGTTPAVINGLGIAPGAIVTFTGGSGPTPLAENEAVSPEGTTVGFDLVVRDGGPPRPRTWDVVVTNPDGSFGTLTGGLTITP